MPVSEGKTHEYLIKYLIENINWNEKNTFLDCGIGIGLIARSIYLSYCYYKNIKNFIFTQFLNQYINSNKNIEEINITGLEIYKNYIIYQKNNPEHNQIRYYFNLYGEIYHNLYNSIISGEKGNFIEYIKNMKEKYDYIIFGDSLEHIEKQDAVNIINIAKQKINKAIIILIPIIEYEQDEVLGNIYEKHLSQWKKEEIENILGLKYINKGETTGLFIYENKIKKE